MPPEVLVPGTRTSTSFEAIGTRWTLTAAEPMTAAVLDRVDAAIAEYDAVWSRFRTDSAVAAVARGEAVDLGPTAPPLLDLLADLRERTAGAMDPFVAASLEHLGYGASTALRPADGYLPAPRAEVVREGTVVRTEPPRLLDVGSAGKGQLVDLVADVLADAGHADALVDASGDLRVAGDPLRVALEHSFDPEAAIGIVEVADGAIAGSAVNRRDWSLGGGRRLHHVLDARTGRPVETIAATWVLADTAMLADALATALFFVGPDTLTDAYDFRWVRMRTDGVADWSADLPGEVFR
ncbi:FAD:protein FMN transferase [Amnibacterium kyonggiense]|uniref:FAD:protein FMN transferase n=1 Tax=Amnibacterium kyonggiense TaxID=595671 RepID=A0A4R7FIF2_9MICO|nr:FAD:protein FMN transferase [Amnibacterium kyonggiense]TDS75871.1 thiamine biosynthesis lipoprotein [Amnibacterium kyonggiense]